MEKTGEPLKIRLPADLERRIRELAADHLRFISQEIVYLLYRGIHCESFQVGVVNGNDDDPQE